MCARFAILTHFALAPESFLCLSSEGPLRASPGASRASARAALTGALVQTIMPLVSQNDVYSLVRALLAKAPSPSPPPLPFRPFYGACSHPVPQRTLHCVTLYFSRSYYLVRAYCKIKYTYTYVHISFFKRQDRSVANGGKSFGIIWHGRY